MAEPKYLSPQELEEAKELTHITNAFRFLADNLKKNTLIIPDGKAEAGKWDTIAGILERARMDYLAEALIRAGCEVSEKATIDWKTGEITPLTEQ